MKHLILFVLIFFAAELCAQTSESLLKNHIEAGKMAYKINADREMHKKMKPSGEIQKFEPGDQKDFWRYDLTIMPPRWIQETAYCMAVGERSYIFVTEEELFLNWTTEKADTIMQFLENRTLLSEDMGIVEMDSTYFGAIPDEIDGDPRVIFFFSALGTYNNSVFDG